MELYSRSKTCQLYLNYQSTMEVATPLLNADCSGWCNHVLFLNAYIYLPLKLALQLLEVYEYTSISTSSNI